MAGNYACHYYYHTVKQKEENQELTPASATHILKDFNTLEAQKQRYSHRHAQNIAEAIKRDSMLPHDYEVVFCVVGSKKYLIDGQHRLAGLVEAGVTHDFRLITYVVKTMEELEDLYCNIDRNHERRNSLFTLVHHVAGHFGIPASRANVVYPAMSWIDSEFCRPYTSGVTVEKQRDMTFVEYEEAIKLFIELTKSATPDDIKVMWSVPFLAVALVTLKLDTTDFSKEFFGRIGSGTARNDEPEKLIMIWWHSKYSSSSSPTWGNATEMRFGTLVNTYCKVRQGERILQIKKAAGKPDAGLYAKLTKSVQLPPARGHSHQ